MDIEHIAESLSPIERKVLPKIQENTNASDLIDDELDHVTVERALRYLESKGLVTIQSSTTKVVDLGILGVNYVKKDLPERVLLNRLKKSDNIPVSEIKNTCNLNENEAKIALGTLKSKAFVDIVQGKVKLTAKPDEVGKKFLEEQFLEILPTSLDNLQPEEKLAYEKLAKRKDIIEVSEKKETIVSLTESGKKISQTKVSDDLIEQVTPKLISSMGWKGKKFRRYDVNAPVPRLYGGKRHFVNQATDYAKSIWLEMGFKEMTGNMTMTGLYNFDALFTAQDHPVREMQDTFYIKNVTGKLPTNKKVVSDIKKAHEGGIDESVGWKGEWNEEDAKRVVLRTHTTCLSAQTLEKIGQTKEFPAKYFALGKCFRNETVDWSHGFEFNQTEGIVIDENANFRQLLGYLIEFFKKMGYDKIRIRPGYFPYTEPSLEIDVFHKGQNKWLELGGAGMFRPEVTIPMFGRHIPVLAWGPGFDRIIMEFFNITDLRDMYKNDLNQLRDMKYWRA